MTSAWGAKDRWPKRGVSALLTLTLWLLAGCGGGSPASLSGGISIPFSITATPGAQSIKAGNGAVYTVSINPVALIGSVNLSTSALPAGVTASFGQGFDVLNGSKTLYIGTTENTPASSSQITIYASDSTGKTHSTSVNLVIAPAADFTLSATPMSQTLKPGTSTQYTVNVALAPNGVGPVMLSAQYLPAGTSASFNPSSLTTSGATTLTITTDPTAPATQTSFTVAGTDASGTYTVPVDLTIAPADFSLTAISPIEIDAGGSYPAQVSVQGLFGATPGNVDLSASGLPAGVSVTFTPSTVAGQAIAGMNIATDSTAQPGTYTLTINGSDASGSNSTTATLVVASGVPGVDVYFGVTPLVENITAGDMATFNLYVSGPEASAPLTVSVDQPDVQASLTPSTQQAGLYQLTITTDAELTLSATATATVTATSASGAQMIAVQVQISPPPPSDVSRGL